MEVNDAPDMSRRNAFRLAGAALAVSAASGTAFAQSSNAGKKTDAPASLNVKMFGAVGDSNADASTGTDDTAAIQAAIDYIDSIGGGTLHFPEGYYLITSFLTLCANLRIVGAGKKGSCIVAMMVGGGGATTGEGVRNGSAFFSNSPSNDGSNVSICIEHIGLISASRANVGAAFYDNGGRQIRLQGCYVSGFKYGVVLDQSELVDIDGCEFARQNVGGAAVYIVNGSTLTPGNGTAFTNRCSVTRCQINEHPTTYGILDEGGYAHSFVDNNYNGCSVHIYAAGVQALKIDGGEFEASQGEACIVLHYRRLDGSGVGGGFGEIQNTLIAPRRTTLSPCIKAYSGAYSVRCNLLLSDQSIPPISGAKHAKLTLSGNYLRCRTGEIVDSHNGSLIDDRIAMPIQTNFSLLSTDLNPRYAGKLIRCTRESPQTLVIKSESDEPFPIGTIFNAQQATPDGTVTFSADAGVAIHGPVSTRAQWQRLIARKCGPDAWDTELVVNDPLVSDITPASVAATGAITSSAGGIGYATGAGGSAVQSISKSDSVKLNKLSGQITLAGSELAASSCASFSLLNTHISPCDLLILNHVSGGTPGAYSINARGAAAGSVMIDITNITGAPLSEVIVLGFAVIKAVAA